MAEIAISELSAHYGPHRVLDGVSLTVKAGEVTSLIGPSGSGKSTLLRVLVGLTRASGGSVSVDGKVVDYGDRKSLRAMREQCAIVFQQFNLFQNMTALQNITVGPLRVQKRDRRSVMEEARELLAKVGLESKGNCYPHQLSGGQQQRVAIARALALRPRFLLLDEVTSALDPELVREVLQTIRVLADEGMTMLLVSHEMGFVRRISNHVVMMADGRVLEAGTAEAIFTSPRAQRTLDFVAGSAT